MAKVRLNGLFSSFYFEDAPDVDKTGEFPNLIIYPCVDTPMVIRLNGISLLALYKAIKEQTGWEGSEA